MRRFTTRLRMPGAIGMVIALLAFVGCVGRWQLVRSQAPSHDLLA